MPTFLEGISPTMRPLSAKSPIQGDLISLLAKRTYQFQAHSRRPEPAEQQRPLRAKAEYDGNPNGRLLADTEAYPYKPRTDIVVHGHVYANGQRTVHAVVSVGAERRELRATGDRRCTRDAYGNLRFSDPTPFDQMPLGYDRAYGGHDRTAEEFFPNIVAQLAPNLPPDTDPEVYSLCAYPRNRHGRGYRLASSRAPIEDLLLPNLEDPADLLLPERVLVPGPFAWWRQPLPSGISWLHMGYFARCVYLGVLPFSRPLPDLLPEFIRRYIPMDVRGINALKGDPLLFNAQNGASLGLQLSGIRGGEAIRLVGLHPSAREIEVEIPAPPKVTIHTRWRPAEAAATAIHHIELYPDEGVFTVVWRGTVPSNRPLLNAELDVLPFSVEWTR